jgi:hypothetical protein
MFPTSGTSPIGLDENEKPIYAPYLGFEEFNRKNNFKHNPQHIYVLSNEKIVKEDWVIDEVYRYNRPLKVVGFGSIESFVKLDLGSNTTGHSNVSNLKKIISTTDPTLGLPRPSDLFLAYYFEVGGPETTTMDPHMEKPIKSNYSQ